MNTQRAINQYSQVNQHSLINEASPHQLIAMLINGALERLNVAKGCIERKETAEKATMISKAMDIIIGLQTSLDLQAGGEISENLNNLYNYMIRRLLVANTTNDVAPVEETIDLLLQIKSGWDNIPSEFHHMSRDQDESTPKAAVAETGMI